MITIDVAAIDNPATHPAPTLELRGDTWVGKFAAMGSPCEILLEGTSQPLAKALVTLAAKEAWRIEHKFSRYVSGNIVDRVNHSVGLAVSVDQETARLLDYADHCYYLTGGQFDITSGVLRQAWKFDGSDQLPTQAKIDSILPLIGWHQVNWTAPEITLAEDMEIDFGGIGKEYAVDRTLMLMAAYVDAENAKDIGLLVNFGGDVACAGSRTDNTPWCIGVESHLNTNAATQAISLLHGGIATSGDTRRFLQKDGIRYSHILNPKSGWPVTEAPHSVTVIAQTCTLAGMMATFAMLEGKNAEQFLSEQQGIKFWVQR